jgi:hypothetical protein
MLRRAWNAAIGGALEADGRATRRTVRGDEDFDGAVEEAIRVE